MYCNSQGPDIYHCEIKIIRHCVMKHLHVMGLNNDPNTCELCMEEEDTSYHLTYKYTALDKRQPVIFDL